MSIKIGVLGFAHGHVGSYLQRWRTEPNLGIEAVAGWDHDAARAKSAADQHGVKLYESPAALLAQPELAGVMIAAETSRHAELVEAAAAAGKAIALQKPLAFRMADGERIVAAVARHRVPFTVAWQMRVDPQNLKIREVLQSGLLGKLFMVRRRHCLGTHLWAGFDEMWHVKPELNRDIWADDAAHPIDFIYWLFGKPVSVTAELASLLNPKIPYDNGIAIFRYANGMMVEVSCSFVCVAAENTVEITGEKGSLVQNYGDATSTNWPRPAGAMGLKWLLRGDRGWTDSGIPSPDSHGARISGLAGPLAEFFQGKRPPLGTAQEGLEVLKMVLACYDSDTAGRRVAL